MQNNSGFFYDFVRIGSGIYGLWLEMSFAKGIGLPLGEEKVLEGVSRTLSTALAAMSGDAVPMPEMPASQSQPSQVRARAKRWSASVVFRGRLRLK